MNFLSPWFLAAAALVAGPLIAHLVRRTTNKRVAFSATRFLSETAPRFERRSQLEHPLLLALRCLVVLALAAAFARPFFKTEAALLGAPAAPRSVAIVVDESASMRRTGLWPEARARIEKLVAGFQPEDRVVLLAAAGSTLPLIDAETWAQTAPSGRAALVAGILDGREPGWGPTYLDTAMEAGIERLEELGEKRPDARKTLVVVSDFAAGARIAGLAGREWPKGTDVQLERIEPAAKPNASVQWLGWTMDSGRGTQARVKVTRDQSAGAAPLKLQLADAANGRALGEATPLTLAAGESRAVLLTVPAGFDGPMRVDLSGDGENFDNAAWAVKPQPRKLELAYLGRHGAADTQHARFYLERAAVGRDPAIAARAANPADAGALAALAPGAFLVVDGPLSAAAVASVRARLEAGAFALVLLAEPEAVATAEALAGERGWRATASVSAGSSAKSDARLGKIDFSHPLFAPFADPRFSDFSRVHFWRPQSVVLPAETTARVVAAFDDGSPAVTEIGVGRGRMIMWSGDWSPAASQWVLSTKFIPWLQALFERAAGGPARPSIIAWQDAPRLAEGKALWSSGGGAGAAAAFGETAPTQPGVFRLRDGLGERWVGLQLPTEESRTDALPADAFERLGVPTKPAAAEARALEQARRDDSLVELEGRQKLWRWLVAGAALLLALESVVAWRAARARSEPGVVASAASGGTS